MGKRFDDKIALVTSSTRGIGLACAERLVREGAKVYLAVRRVEAGKQIARLMEAEGGKAGVESMIDDTLEREGRLDILVNNFGHTDVAKDLDLLQGDTQAFFDIVNINLKSVYIPCKAAVRSMLETGGGSIVNISSVGGAIPDLSRTAYGVAKAAINFLTRDIAVQYAASGIRCNAVLPGMTATDAVADNMSSQFSDTFLKNVPLGRVGRPEDIAAAVAFLASEEASYITGQILPVAGGFGEPTPLYGMYSAAGRRS